MCPSVFVCAVVCVGLQHSLGWVVAANIVDERRRENNVCLRAEFICLSCANLFVKQNCLN